MANQNFKIHLANATRSTLSTGILQFVPQATIVPQPFGAEIYAAADNALVTWDGFNVLVNCVQVRIRLAVNVLINGNFVWAFDGNWPRIFVPAGTETATYPIPAHAAQFWDRPFRFSVEAYGSTTTNYLGTTRFSGQFVLQGVTVTAPVANQVLIGTQSYNITWLTNMQSTTLNVRLLKNGA